MHADSSQAGQLVDESEHVSLTPVPHVQMQNKCIFEDWAREGWVSAAEHLPAALADQNRRMPGADQHHG